MTDFVLFYDSHCPLCAAEMRRLAAWDGEGRLAYQDMQAEDFDADRYGTTWAAMDAELHALGADGRMRIGIEAILAAYQAVGQGWRVFYLKPELTKPLWRRVYRWFAQNRYRVSRLMGYRCDSGVCDRRYR